MHKLKLHYFDFHGGRGEATRLAMSLGGIPFEDRRIPLSDWASTRSSMPLHAVPVLEVDGEPITQSNSMNRFIGRLVDLYPENSLEALRCDEVMGIVEDALHKTVVTFFIEDEDEKRTAREKLAEGPLTLYLTRLQEILASRGDYFADGRLTVADLKVFVWIRNLRSGTLDYIPVDLADRVAPALVDHMNRIAAHPGIVAYYEAQEASE